MNEEEKSAIKLFWWNQPRANVYENRQTSVCAVVVSVVNIEKLPAVCSKFLTENVAGRVRALEQGIKISEESQRS